MSVLSVTLGVCLAVQASFGTFVILLFLRVDAAILPNTSAPCSHFGFFLLKYIVLYERNNGVARTAHVVWRRCLCLTMDALAGVLVSGQSCSY